jgi:hypothetical protein
MEAAIKKILMKGLEIQSNVTDTSWKLHCFKIVLIMATYR